MRVDPKELEIYETDSLVSHPSGVLDGTHVYRVGKNIIRLSLKKGVGSKTTCTFIVYMNGEKYPFDLTMGESSDKYTGNPFC